MYKRQIDLAEKEYDGLVIVNQGANFSVGANLAMILMMAIEQDWDDLNMAIAYFQKSMMRVRYSSVPVVVAPHGLTLGGGCEMTMHADKVVAAAAVSYTHLDVYKRQDKGLKSRNLSKEVVVNFNKKVVERIDPEKYAVFKDVMREIMKIANEMNSKK